MTIRTGFLPAITIAVAVAAASPAAAQIVGLGATKGGVVASVTANISKVVSEHAGMQMRTQPMAGTQQYIPVVNAGQLDFGISNIMQFNMAVTGTGLSKGHKYDNLRVVAKLMLFRTGPVVAADSKIQRFADLKGKRVPYGFKASPLFQDLMTGYLVNGGLTWKDVVRVPVVTQAQMWDLFKQGKVDTAVGNPGSGLNKELAASIRGGIRQLPYETETPGAKAMLKMWKGVEYRVLNPGKAFVAIKKPTMLMWFPFLIWTHKGEKDDIVYRVTKALYEHADELKAASPVWATFTAKGMPSEAGDGTFHPGAIKFYKEAGVWKGK